MSAQFPRNNLAPESQPWGRDLEQRLAALELYRDTQATRTDNTYAGVQGSLKALGTQITNISSLLSHVVIPQGFDVTTSNFNTGTTGAYQTTTTLTAPAGATRAVVTALGFASVVNGASIPIGLGAWIMIGTVAGDNVDRVQQIPVGTAGQVTASAAASVTGTSIPVVLQIGTGATASGTNVNNKTHLYGTVLWLP